MQCVCFDFDFMNIEMQIRASDIDFWSKNYNSDMMEIRHKTKMYPPRIKMTVCMKSSDQQLIKLQVKFIGCSGDSQLGAELIFPQGNSQVFNIHDVCYT